jgi:NAD(P)H-flavin reductase
MSVAGNVMLPQTYRITRVQHESADTFTLSLQPSTGAASPLTFAPGQFNMLYVFGAGEVPISISGNPARPDPLVHTIRAVGSVTNLLARCRKGDMVGVRGPFGAPWPVQAAQGKDVIIAAGGLGLAPLRPIVYQVLAAREKFGKVSLLYGTRQPEDILFAAELEKWRGRFDLDVHVTVANATPAWRGSVGWITALIPRVSFAPATTAAFICGPELMMRSTANELIKRGVPAAQIAISMERNMKCAVGFCGHCQFGPTFICKDGPVFPYNRIRDLMLVREL